MRLPILFFALLLSLSAFGQASAQTKPARPSQHGAKRTFPRPSRAVQTLLKRATKQKGEEARKTLEAATQEAERAKDRAGLLAVGAAWNRLGYALKDANEPDKAREYFLRALAIFERYKPQSLGVVFSLHILGNTASNKRDFVTAKRFYERALAVQEKLAPNSLSRANLLYSLGNVAYSQGDLAGAKQYYQRALALHEKLPPNSLAMAKSLNNLGAVARDQGDLPAAKQYYQRALAIQEKLAPNSLDFAGSLCNLGNVTSDQGDPTAAKEYYRRALAVLEKAAPQHPFMANTLLGLGIIAINQGDPAGAKQYYQRALVIREKIAPNSLDVANSLHNLGNVAGDQGDLAGEKQYQQRALAIREKLAPNSLDVAKSLNNLGAVAYYQDDLAGTKQYLQRALAIQEKLAPNSLAMAMSLNNLGNVARDQGDLVAAKQYQQRALAIQEKLAPNSLDVAASLNNLGDVAYSQGDLAGTKQYQQRALAIREKLAPNSPDLSYNLRILGLLLDETGDFRSALATFQKALDILDKSAPNSTFAPDVLRSLARLLLEQGTSDQAKLYLKRAEQIEDAIKKLPREPNKSRANNTPIIRPFIQITSDMEEIKGDEVTLKVVFLSPIPVARYHVWINGRPFGDTKQGFDLPQIDEKGRILDKGRVLDKGDVIEKGRVLDKGRILDKGEDREQLAKEVPAEAAELVRDKKYAYFLQLRLTFPVEDTDGEFIRIAMQAETTGGSISDREILRLRRPQAEQNRGALRVLAIGVGNYEHLPHLQFAAADALEMGDALKMQAGDDKLYRGADITLLTEQEATLPRIRRALDEFTANVRPGDTLILSLSGHGIKKGENTYFAPVRFDPENCEGTGLDWKEVIAKLEEARKTARAVWVLADCCRAAPGLRKEATARDLKRGIEEGGNLILCTASSGDTPSYESEDLKHGLFTAAWLEALRGQAPEFLYEPTARGRVLTLSGLQFAVDASVRKYARAAGVRQVVEFPRLEGSFSPAQPIFMLPTGKGTL